MVWVLDAGLPPPLCNWPVADVTGTRIGRPDLLCEEVAVVGEIDDRALVVARMHAAVRRAAQADRPARWMTRRDPGPL